MNPMQEIRIEKVTLNFGAGKDANKLEKGQKLLKNITGIPPVKTITNKRIAAWSLRPGLPIGCKITVRGEEAKALLVRLVKAKDDTILSKQFCESGTFSFGIPEYIDIPGAEYDPELGIMGFEVSVTLCRPGYRVKSRKIKPTKLPTHHKITKKEAIEFMTKEFGITTEVEK
jgi:large subunit ribosomal protein L5